MKLANAKLQVVLNVLTQAINMLDSSQLILASVLPAYGLTKNAGTMLLQQMAKGVYADKLRIVSFHPAMIYNELFDSARITKMIFLQMIVHIALFTLE